MVRSRVSSPLLGLIFVLTLYVSAYFATVHRGRVRFGVGLNGHRGVVGQLISTEVNRRPAMAFYSPNHDVLEKFFAPVHWLDRKVRFSFWNPQVDP